VAKAKNRLAIVKLSAKEAEGAAGSQNEEADDDEYDQPPGVQSYSDGDDEE
jgi:hypothetical protein